MFYFYYIISSNNINNNKKIIYDNNIKDNYSLLTEQIKYNPFYLIF